MVKWLKMWFALLCSGIDFPITAAVDKSFRADNYALEHSTMATAWQRVANNPWSFLHHWVNLVTSWYETPRQEVTAKATGWIMILHGIVCAGVGILIGAAL
jgi:hypothetical protein